MTEKSKQIIQLQINKLKYLPALPESSLKILDAINDPDVHIDKLAEVLSLSPGLAARLLGLANSAYFGHPRQINDLRTAIVQVLGTELVKSLSLGVVLNVHFDTRKCQAFSTEYFWMRSLLTALAAQKLAVGNIFQPFSVATVYTSGLLLYIGVLVLAYLMPEDMDIILQRSHKNGTGVGEEIRLQLGETHYRVGYFLLQKWQLSSVYQGVLNHFEDADFCGEEKSLLDLLKLSQRLSSMLLNNEDVIDIDALKEWSDRLLLSTAELRKIGEELIESRESVQKLACIMGGR